MSGPADDFKVSPHERTSPLWRALANHYTERLAMLRAQNDAAKSPEDTAHLRGRIAECKSLLALADDRPVIPQN